eukprot:scaffold1878_cov355-Prasinococcus_capsulatus_cf.AAC.5
MVPGISNPTVQLVGNSFLVFDFEDNLPLTDGVFVDWLEIEGFESDSEFCLVDLTFIGFPDISVEFEDGSNCVTVSEFDPVDLELQVLELNGLPSLGVVLDSPFELKGLDMQFGGLPFPDSTFGVLSELVQNSGLDLTVSTASNVILLFDFGGASVPAQSEPFLLFQIVFPDPVAGETFCVTDITLSAPPNDELNTNFPDGPCITFPSEPQCEQEPNSYDPNGDGEVNVLDPVAMVNHIIGNPPFDECQFLAADGNADGAVNVFDVIGAINIIIGG